MPDTPSVVIVHTLEDMRSAMKTAAQSRSPLILQSAPDAIFYAGSLYLLTLFRQAQAEFPEVDAIFILDCGDAGAEALSAMRIGHTHIRSSAPEALSAKISDIAGQLGVTIIPEASA